MPDRTVAIDGFLEKCDRPLEGYATVAVDVIRASTTAVTAVAMGRRCFPVPSVEAATLMASELGNVLLAGEVGGNLPFGFEVTNSPHEMAIRTDIHRPMVLLSSSGTRLMARLEANGPAYVGCFRNYSYLIQHLAKHHAKVVVVGAVTRGEFREEDQMCCAWIAEGLMAAGYRAEDERTTRLVERWSGAAPDAFLGSDSVKYLRATGQERDLDFVLSHFDDLRATFELNRGELVMTPARDTESFTMPTHYARNVLVRLNTRFRPEGRP
jgi:2-phosphosulfolactate phosphatase